jgi:predicted nucleotidyltransferase
MDKRDLHFICALSPASSKLVETMLAEHCKERSSRTMKDQAPERHQIALDMLVAKLREDRHVLAAILFGSLVRGEAWEKSDIDLVAVLRDGVERECSGYWLLENGVSIWLETIPRSQLKQQFERALPGTIRHAMHSQARLLFAHDESIASWLQRTEQIGGRDQAYQLLRDSLGLPYLLEKAEKWLHVKRDPDYCFVWLLYAVSSLARIEVTLHGEAPRREVLDRALALNPDFFKVAYTDFVNGAKDEQSLQQQLERIEVYLLERADQIFAPLLDYLAEAGDPRTLSAINAHFAPKLPQAELFLVCDWLAEKGILEKMAAPLRLTRKSQVTVEEVAFYYDSERRIL